MSAAELLELAQAEGVLLLLDDGRLTWEADHEPPGELLDEIRSHRLEIIEALSAANDPPQQAMEWLARLAALLDCYPGYLLEHGFVDRHDLAEQHRQHPRFAARLIRSNPQWRRPSEFCDQYAKVRDEACELHGVTVSRSPTWDAARDAFHRHALGNCPQCYPALGRYCETGVELRARYLEAEP